MVADLNILRSAATRGKATLVTLAGPDRFGTFEVSRYQLVHGTYVCRSQMSGIHQEDANRAFDVRCQDLAAYDDVYVTELLDGVAFGLLNPREKR